MYRMSKNSHLFNLNYLSNFWVNCHLSGQKWFFETPCMSILNQFSNYWLCENVRNNMKHQTLTQNLQLKQANQYVHLEGTICEICCLMKKEEVKDQTNSHISSLKTTIFLCHCLCICKLPYSHLLSLWKWSCGNL